MTTLAKIIILFVAVMFACSTGIFLGIIVEEYRKDRSIRDANQKWNMPCKAIENIDKETENE